MSAREVILDILRKAYQIEVDGFTFYSMTASRAEKTAVRELFDKLAHDETQHQAFLREVLRGYDERGSAAFHLNLRTPELTAFTQKIFTDRFRAQAAGAQFEVAALSIGMTLETRAIEHFTSAAAQATDADVKRFYEFLADWERQHLDALSTLYGAVRTDFWEQSGFAPF
ncbi:MAG: ferritin-like domain-containing protein [Acidobacteriota bacterium]